MKTTAFIFLLFLPLWLHGQGKMDSIQNKIVTQGEMLIAQGLIDSAEFYAQSILHTERKNELLRRQASYVLGRALFENGSPDEAIEPIRNAILRSRKSKDSTLLLKTLITYAAIWAEKEEPDLDSTIVYLLQSQSLASTLKDTFSLGRVIISYSNVLYMSRQYEEALKYNYLFESLSKSSNVKESQIATNEYAKANSLMELYILQEKEVFLKEAKKSYLNAINLFHKNNNKINEAHARNALANCLLYFSNLNDASGEIWESIKIGEASKDTSILINGYYNLANLEEMNGDATSAIFALEQLRYLLNVSGLKSDFSFMAEQFGNSDSRVSIALINSKINIFQKQIENKTIKNRNNLLTLALFLLASVAIGLYFFINQKNRLNIQKQKLLEEEQKLLQEEIKNLSKTREIEFMQARLAGEESGRHRIAQQIHDGVGGLLISTKWNLESALEDLSKSKNKVADRLQENLRLQENSYLELRRVMYELERGDLPWWEALQQFCTQIAQHKNVKIHYYTYNLDENAAGKLGEEVRLVIQELITNALKHANASEINIQVSQIDGELDVIVEDNGIGFDKQKISKGIGMRSIDDRVKRLDGKYSIESKEGVGTIVFMDVPLKPQKAMENPKPLYASAN